VPVVEDLDAKVIDDLKQKSCVQKGEIQPVRSGPKEVLYGDLNAKQISGFDEQIKNKDQNQIRQEKIAHQVTSAMKNSSWQYFCECLSE
jgi:hypothetical protein